MNIADRKELCARYIFTISN